MTETRKDFQFLAGDFSWEDVFAPPNQKGHEESSDPAAPNRPEQTSQLETLSVPAHIRVKSVPDIYQEFQVTISPKTRLKPKEAAILLTIVAADTIEHGLDLPRYLAAQYLLEINRSLSVRPDTNRDSHKKALALMEAVLLATGKTEWFTLNEVKLLSPEVMGRLLTISFWPSRRTLMSWRHYHRPERFLELKIVPLEQYLERPSNTIPYSGYTKGYHESGRGYTRDGMVYGKGKTPFDPEIDEDRDSAPADLSSPIDEDPEYQSLIHAILKAKERNRKGHKE